MHLHYDLPIKFNNMSRLIVSRCKLRSYSQSDEITTVIQPEIFKPIVMYREHNITIKPRFFLANRLKCIDKYINSLFDLLFSDD